MPTSSERLRARARAYGAACVALTDKANTADDALEAEECERVANSLYIEYDRLRKLAEKRKQKERDLGAHHA